MLKGDCELATKDIKNKSEKKKLSTVIALDTHTRKEGKYGQLLFAFCYGRTVGQDAGLHVTLP